MAFKTLCKFLHLAMVFIMEEIMVSAGWLGLKILKKNLENISGPLELWSSYYNRKYKKSKFECAINVNTKNKTKTF